DSHLSNELTDLLINRWTAITTLRTSRPAAAKPVPMPAHNGVGSNDHQRRTPVLPAYRQGDPEESVAGLQRDSLLDAFDRCQLLAQGHVLEDQLSMAAQHQRQAADNRNEQLQHTEIVAGIGAHFNSDRFGEGHVSHRRAQPRATSSEASEARGASVIDASSATSGLTAAAPVCEPDRLRRSRRTASGIAR